MFSWYELLKIEVDLSRLDDVQSVPLQTHFNFYNSARGEYRFNDGTTIQTFTYWEFNLDSKFQTGIYHRIISLLKIAKYFTSFCFSNSMILFMLNFKVWHIREVWSHQTDQGGQYPGDERHSICGVWGHLRCQECMRPSLRIQRV